MSTSLAHSPTNDNRFQDALKVTRELARTHAAGGRALPHLAGNVVKWAVEGIVSTNKPKKGEHDDAKKLYDAYLDAHSSKFKDLHSDDGKKANVSKIRRFIKLGEMTTIDPVNEFSRWLDRRAKLAEQDPKSVRPEYQSYYDLAGVQLENSDNPLSDDMIDAALLKKETEEPEIMDALESVKKKLEKLIAGEGVQKDQHEFTVTALDYVNRRIAALIVENDTKELLEKAAKLGYVVNNSQASLAA